MNPEQISQPQIKPHKLVSFFRHLSQATKKIEARELAKKRLAFQLGKVKALSKKPTKKPLLELEFKKLERRMTDLLEIERTLLKKRNIDSKVIDILTGKITDMQKDIYSLEREKTTQTTTNKSRIEAIQHSLAELKAKIETYIDIKTLRDRRMEELEYHIKQTVDTNKIELFVTQEQIDAMEERLKAIQSKGEADEEKITNIKRRIELLKEKARQPYM